jgi:hypothetical protein
MPLITRTLLLLSLTAPLALALVETTITATLPGTSGTADLDEVGSAFKDFFTFSGPAKKAADLPDCIVSCLVSVATDLKCAASDVQCLCAADTGKAWNDKVVECNKNSKATTTGDDEGDKCEEDDMEDDVEIVAMCQGLKREAGKMNETVAAMKEVLGEEAEGEDGKVGKKGRKGTAASGASTVEGVGKTAVGALAAVFGFAVALL